MDQDPDKAQTVGVDDPMVPLSVAAAMASVGSAAKRDRSLIVIVGTTFFVVATVAIVLASIVSGSLSNVDESTERTSKAVAGLAVSVDSLSKSVGTLADANATQAARLEQQGRFLDAVNDLLLCDRDPACIARAVDELRAARSIPAPASPATPSTSPPTTVAGP